jgi:membrane fusion protein, multidrug efflux system
LPAHPMNSETIGPDHQLPAPKGRKRNFVRVLIWAVVLLVFAAGILLVLRHKNDVAAAPQGRRGAGGGTVTVTTTTAKEGDIGVYLDAIGTVTPTYTASITSQVNGIITAVNYREGQLVNKGDSLVEVDSRPYQANLVQAQGALEHDEGVLAQAKMDLARYRDAWSRNAIPKQTLDDQEKVVAQDEGTVKQDQGTVQFDQVQLDYCHITSPITGKVGLRLVDPGNVVQSTGSTTLAVVTQMQPITVIFTIPEDNLGQVTPHLRQKSALKVTAFDRSGQHQIASGTLLTVDNQIDTTTGTVKARSVFANKDGALYPNQFVNTRLLTDTVHHATLIPSSAIQHNGTEAFVYVLQSNVAHMRSVTTGVVDGDTTQVTGINPGDVLANSSFDKLQDNSKVVVSDKPLPSSTSGSSAP